MLCSENLTCRSEPIDDPWAVDRQSGAAIPPDDVTKKLTVANPDDPKMRHISVAGGTYTILVSGEETGGRYCLVDMLVPPGGGPPPHRHDFEEMFTILDGEIELNFRGETHSASAGSTVNIPANAPHSFRNKSDKPARLPACARQRGRRSSSWRLAIRSIAAPRRHRSSARPSRPSGYNEQRPFRPNIERSCWSEVRRHYLLLNVPQ
jgi:quercetin dioxygenase-like cupin family protein